LKKPIFQETAAYGHMGRPSEKKSITIGMNGKKKSLKVETFAWEKLDYVNKVKKAFKLK